MEHLGSSSEPDLDSGEGRDSNMNNNMIIEREHEQQYYLRPVMMKS